MVLTYPKISEGFRRLSEISEEVSLFPLLVLTCVSPKTTSLIVLQNSRIRGSKYHHPRELFSSFPLVFSMKFTYFSKQCQLGL